MELCADSIIMEKRLDKLNPLLDDASGLQKIEDKPCDYVMLVLPDLIS